MGQYDDTVLEMSNRFMCSELCPCLRDSESYRTWAGEDISEAYLNKYGRTKSGRDNYEPIVFYTEQDLENSLFTKTYASASSCLSEIGNLKE